MKILVIGNGSSVMDDGFGSIVDSEFDVVVRFNRFKTKGYEKYVGTKTDVWVVADVGLEQWVLNSKKGIEASESNEKFKYKNIFICCPKFKIGEFISSYGSVEDYRKRIEESDFGEGVIGMIPPQIEDEMEEIVNFRPAWPSCGLVTLTLFCGLYPNQIYCHGFDSCSPKYEFIEYFENSDERKTSYARRPNRVDHHLDAELEYLNFLIGNNLVKNLKDHVTPEGKII